MGHVHGEKNKYNLPKWVQATKLSNDAKVNGLACAQYITSGGCVMIE